MFRRADETSRPTLNAPYVAKKYLDRGRNTVFLKNRDMFDSWNSCYCTVIIGFWHLSLIVTILTYTGNRI